MIDVQDGNRGRFVGPEVAASSNSKHMGYIFPSDGLYNYGLEQEQGKLHSEKPSDQHGSEGRRIGRRNASQAESERERRPGSIPLHPRVVASLTARPGPATGTGPFSRASMLCFAYLPYSTTERSTQWTD